MTIALLILALLDTALLLAMLIGQRKKATPIHAAHQASRRGEPVECPHCHCLAAKYDERGICVNCVAEGK